MSMYNIAGGVARQQDRSRRSQVVVPQPRCPVHGKSRRCCRPMWCRSKKAIVLCAHEKPLVQAPEPSAGLSEAAQRKSPDGQTHDYERHGTTTRVAALEVATGKVLTTHSKRRRRVELLDFVDRVTVSFPNRQLPVILDKVSTQAQGMRNCSMGASQRETPLHADERFLAR